MRSRYIIVIVHESKVWPKFYQSTIKPLIQGHLIPKLKCFSSRRAVVLAQSIEVENEDVVGTAPTCAAPITSM